jgi:hypothetical protein
MIRMPQRLDDLSELLKQQLDRNSNVVWIAAGFGWRWARSEPKMDSGLA